MLRLALLASHSLVLSNNVIVNCVTCINIHITILFLKKSTKTVAIRAALLAEICRAREEKDWGNGGKDGKGREREKK